MIKINDYILHGFCMSLTDSGIQNPFVEISYIVSAPFQHRCMNHEGSVHENWENVAFVHVYVLFRLLTNKGVFSENNPLKSKHILLAPLVYVKSPECRYIFAF